MILSSERKKRKKGKGRQVWRKITVNFYFLISGFRIPGLAGYAQGAFDRRFLPGYANTLTGR